MGSEVEFIAKYMPSLLVVVAVIVLIAYTKRALFQGVVSKEMFDEQIERERNFVNCTKEAAVHLEEIGRQLEGISQKQADDVREQTLLIQKYLSDVAERLRTLELVFSDHIDVIRNLSYQIEKQRKNIPETEKFVTKRKEKPE